MSYLDRTDLAHVVPDGPGFDEIGRGEEEGVSNIRAVEPEVSQASIDMIKQVSSTGYLRKRLPQELMVLQGGATAALDAAGEVQSVTTVEAISATVIDERTKARMQGYEGDPCDDCGNFTLVRNGTCMKCNTCGSTTGCS